MDLIWFSTVFVILLTYDKMSYVVLSSSFYLALDGTCREFSYREFSKSHVGNSQLKMDIFCLDFQSSITH